MFAYIDIIFLLFVAVLIFVRLNSVLGTRPEKDGKIFISKEDFLRNHPDLVREIKEKLHIDEEVSGLDTVLMQIPGFYRPDFCAKASKVFEMILTAFASGDEETLTMLTGKKLFARFKEIIDTRREQGIVSENDLIRIEDVCIVDAKISSKGIAQIVVQFVSEQINLLRNATGQVIEGDENFVQKITDIWTFEKDIKTSSPTWLLVSTKKK